MSTSAIQAAMDFMENEKQFHLGFLPTEQSSPLTRELDKKFAVSNEEGVKNLQSVDRNVAAMAKRIFASAEFAKLVETGEKVLRDGGKIIFSGCGATGRLSILLECMWRNCCVDDPAVAPDWEDIAQRTGEAARWLTDHVEVKPDRGEYANDILRDLRTRRISLNEGQMAEVKSRYGSYNDFRKTMFGSFVLSKDGTPLDVVWQELASQYPGTFDADIGDADMALELADIVERLRDMDLAAQEWAYQREDVLAQMQQRVYDGYWSVSTLKTVADQWQKKVDDLKKAHEKTMNELDQARTEIREIEDQYRWEIRELRRKGREAVRASQAATAQRY